MTIVSCEKFLLLRAGTEQLKAAEGLAELRESLQHFTETVGSACDHARTAIIEAQARAHEQGERHRERHAAVQNALENGGLAELEAERARLLADLRAACRRCSGANPFDCDCPLKDQ